MADTTDLKSGGSNTVRVRLPLPAHNCHICDKEICEEEWIVNWTACSDCFDFNYDRYLMTHDKLDYDES